MVTTINKWLLKLIIESLVLLNYWYDIPESEYLLFLSFNI